ncbi:MAG: hypothetical protein E6G90_05645, partial [Alphaproteobacteria bacterium]
DAAFATLAPLHAGALAVGADSFFTSRREQIVALASRYGIPAIYEGRSFAASGGLISYGSSLAAVNRQVAAYVGRILKGAKPADLPVEQPTRFELVVISRPPRRSASPCRPRSSRGPTRSSNEPPRITAPSGRRSVPRGSNKETLPGYRPLLQKSRTGPSPYRELRRGALLLELRGPPPDRGGHAFGRDHFAELLAELGLGRVERADDVEAGINRGAKAGGVGPAVDRTLGGVERFRRNQREPLGPA